MIIKGDRRGGFGQLADHLLRRDTNEEVHVREIENYPAKQLNDQSLRNALRLMETQGNAKGRKRTLYHAIIAPQQGESLNQKQLKIAVDTLAANLGMSGHQRVIVEHKKAGRQHFHVVFNIVSPTTGKLARLQWTRKKQWNTARQLEQELGLKPVISKGRPARQWEHQRGKRSGIDPLKVRKEITAIYKASNTAPEFITALDRAGYVLSKGWNNSYVVVDKAGHIHGLMRRIEGAKLKDLRQKFPDLKTAKLRPLNDVLKKLRPAKGKTGAWRQQSQRFSRPVWAASNFTSPTGKKDLSLYPNLGGVTARVRHKTNAEEKKQAFRYAAWPISKRKKRLDENKPSLRGYNKEEIERAELLAWAFENGRADVLAMYGIYLDQFDI